MQLDTPRIDSNYYTGLAVAIILSIPLDLGLIWLGIELGRWLGFWN